MNKLTDHDYYEKINLSSAIYLAKTADAPQVHLSSFAVPELQRMYLFPRQFHPLHMELVI
jgi:hypothetical protein